MDLLIELPTFILIGALILFLAALLTKEKLVKFNPLKTASVFIGLMPLVGIFSFVLIYSSPEFSRFISIVSGGISLFLFYVFVVNLYRAGVQNQNPS